MKKVLLHVLCCMISVLAFGQADIADENFSERISIPERSEALNQLYEEAKYLENNGTAFEIDENRLAIKNEWSLISPEVAALYKPIEVSVTEDELNIMRQKERPSSIPNPTIREWADDLLLRDEYLDGVDMDVTTDGTIYIVSYENIIEQGGLEDEIHIYKSTNSGESFQSALTFEIDVPIQKLQIITLNNDDVLLYFLLEGGNFWGAFIDTDEGFSFGSLIVTGISDFSVDKNYPLNTQNTRFFGTFLKEESCVTQVFSARTTASSQGMEWVDETDLYGICGDQIDFAYGRNGATYTTFLGAESGNLYAGANNDFNDPASWSPRETVELGVNHVNINPVIKAARKVFSDDEVMIFTQGRGSESTNGYNHKRFARINGGSFNLQETVIALEFESFGPIDAWVKRENGVEIIQTNYIQDYAKLTFFDKVLSFPYNGVFMGDQEVISDEGNRIWSGFPAAIAETIDGLPCIAYVGKNGPRPYGLYFDRKSDILATPENSIISLQYYPNPSKGKFTVNASQDIEKISLYSITGMELKEFSPNKKNVNINIEDLPSGIYLMVVHSNNQKSTHKIIKK